MTTDFEEFLTENADSLNEYILKAFNNGEHPDMDRYLYNLLTEYSANGGKRHRPLSCMLAAVAVGGKKVAKKAICAGVAIEHFHTAALIHDDIADDSTLRRGEPCMHITHGIGLAINAGDFALSSVTGTVVKSEDLSNEEKLLVLRELVDMTDRTIEGQALDIGWARDNRFDLTIDDYLMMATHKTAYYSGAVPLAVGCALGGGDLVQVEAMRSFGENTGLAFQIYDDVLNLVGSQEATKKDFRSDITEGKRTLIMVHAIQNSERADELIEILSSHTADEVKLARAVEICEESGSIQYARDYAKKLTQDAITFLHTSMKPSTSRDLLESMATFFISRKN